MHVKNLECSFCHREYDARRLHNVCAECAKAFRKADLSDISR